MTGAFFRGFGILLAYLLLTAGGALLVRRLHPRMDRELFRKTLHVIVLFALPVFLLAFPDWRLSAAAALALAALIYPVLAIGERFRGYGELLIQRKNGEVRRSMVLLFSTYTVIIALCWGWLGDRMLAMACVYAWGFGDAAAALVGKRFGRSALHGPLIEGRKSLEGTAAMFAVSFVSVFAIMLARGGLSVGQCLLVAALAAGASAGAELYTPGGYDTATCPAAAASVILPLVILWQGFPS
ncbi:MAG TPA: phosphatidate cytidylyltransferase [Candidatus Limnocylindria bacterium]|nr:phosphatidate cytidylyltransferase [Candidatus Limnocylindria bacterium]